MKVIIAGGREVTDIEELYKAIIACPFTFTEVVSGCAKGADTLGEEWAEDNGIRIKKFPPEWNKHGKSAGAIRNKEMGDYADCAIMLWDGKSRGTKHMISVMEKLKKPYYIHYVQ